jgi:hypothetical protein
MAQEVRKRIDRLLAFLESRDGVKSNGTMLLIDNVAMQTRMTQLDTRLVYSIKLKFSKEMLILNRYYVISR